MKIAQEDNSFCEMQEPEPKPAIKHASAESSLSFETNRVVTVSYPYWLAANFTVFYDFLV